jgi:peptidoglycan/LPS O-acetylase OafA/YrhL
MAPADKARLPGLDGLRAIAAVAVTLHHFSQIRLVFGLPTLWGFAAISWLGPRGVSLFFVLSGFLITYLLEKEREQRGRVAIGRFYIRRVLRIWPVYFIVTALGFFVVPFLSIFALPGFPPVVDAHFWQKLALYCALSPHVEASLYAPVNYAGVLWSVGVEEWFYLVWPLLLFTSRRFLLAILPAIVIALLAARYEFRTGVMFYLFSQIRFDCMAVGAIGALYLTSERVNAQWRLIYSPIARTGLLACLLYLIASGTSFGAADELVYSTLFLWLILTAAFSGHHIVRLDHPWLKWIGNVSYGLYCYNWIALVLASRLLKLAGLNQSNVAGHLVDFAFGLAVSLCIAALSFGLIERPVLRVKDRLFSAGRTSAIEGFDDQLADAESAGAAIRR